MKKYVVVYSNSYLNDCRLLGLADSKEQADNIVNGYLSRLSCDDDNRYWGEGNEVYKDCFLAIPVNENELLDDVFCLWGEE